MKERNHSDLKYVNAPRREIDLENLYGEEVVPLALTFNPHPECGVGRPTRPEHVKNLTNGEAFDMAKTRVALSLRSDGRYARIDGNHTCERAIKEGFTHIKARVYINLTIADEAALFTAWDTQRRITKFQHFANAIAAGNADAINVQRIAREQGFEIGPRSKPGVISAVGPLMSVHETYGAGLLADTLSILRRAYNYDGDGTKAPAIAGMAAFLRRYLGAIQQDRLITEIQGQAKAPASAAKVILEKARVMAASFPATSHDNAPVVKEDGKARRMSGFATSYGLTLREIYNRRLRSAQLPPWKSRAFSDRTLAAKPEAGRKSHETRRRNMEGREVQP